MTLVRPEAIRLVLKDWLIGLAFYINGMIQKERTHVHARGGVHRSSKAELR